MLFDTNIHDVRQNNTPVNLALKVFFKNRDLSLMAYMQVFSREVKQVYIDGVVPLDEIPLVATINEHLNPALIPPFLILAITLNWRNADAIIMRKPIPTSTKPDQQKRTKVSTASRRESRKNVTSISSWTRLPLLGMMSKIHPIFGLICAIHSLSPPSRGLTG